MLNSPNKIEINQPDIARPVPSVPGLTPCCGAVGGGRERRDQS
ncbi:MAG TPA: hypothetical protein V6D14_29175 [Coleofasciculaceae cyanobacterium]